MSAEREPDPFYACDGKVRFRRHTQAKVCKRSMEEREGGDTFHTYWCRNCQGWHVGHADLFRRRKLLTNARTRMPL